MTPRSYYEQALQQREHMVEIRRDLHRHPELGFQEIRTSGIVAAHLNELGLDVQTGVGQTGVVGLLEGHQDGPTLLVRADMDALPIVEANKTEYVSQNPGVMHACGHDAHTTIALTVASMLSAQRDQLKGRVKFVFQPAEEIAKGASAMIAAGVLESPRPDYSFGLHVWNSIPVGQIGVTSGPCMAAADTFNCKLTGRGGHGAKPDETYDPIVAAAHIITACQTIASRNVSPLDTAVVTFGAMHSGEAFNIIPETAELKGTIRTYKKDTKEYIHRRFREIVTGVAAVMQCEAEIDIQSLTMAVDNDPVLAERVAALAVELVGTENVRRDIRTMGGEDMALLMDDIPGCFFFVGTGPEETGAGYPHHNPHFDIEEDALVYGAALMANTVASFLLD